jgi:hypothetical protein
VLLGSNSSSARSPVWVACGVLLGAEEAAELIDAVEALAAEVVLAALEDGNVDLTPQRTGGRGHVLRQQLLLESFRGRSDDDALARGERGDEVREALPRTRARLRQEVLAALERGGDGLREGSLTRPGLVAGKGRRQTAGRTEVLLHGERRA